MDKMQAGPVFLELPAASSFPPSGPNYIMSFGSGLLYPPLPAFEKTLVIPLSHSGHPGSPPVKSLISAVESFLLHKATQSQGPEITIRSSWELSFHHEGVWKGFVPVLGLGELRGQW